MRRGNTQQNTSGCVIERVHGLGIVGEGKRQYVYAFCLTSKLVIPQLTSSEYVASLIVSESLKRDRPVWS